MMYQGHLLTQLLPFWNQAFNELHGGIYTCYTNDGKTLVSETSIRGAKAECFGFSRISLAHRPLHTY